MIGLGSGKAIGLHLLVEAVTVLHFCLSVMPVPFSKVAVMALSPVEAHAVTCLCCRSGTQPPDSCG